MLKDGLYDLTYRLANAQESTSQTALVMLRDGKILGSDRWGGVFEGRYSFDASSGRHAVDVRFRVPAGGSLVTSIAPCVDGEWIDVATELTELDGRGVFEVPIQGEQVHFELDYRGLLPD